MKIIKKHLKNVLITIFDSYLKHHLIKKLVVCECKERFDNGWVLFCYLVKERKDLIPVFRYGNNYVDAESFPKASHHYQIENKDSLITKIKKIFRLRVLENSAATYFFTQYVWVPKNKKSRRIYLGHGAGLKKAIFYTNPIYATGVDIVYPTIEYYEMHKIFATYNNNRIIISGQPRSDICFETERNRTIFNSIIRKKEGEKVVLVVITFRTTSAGPDYSRVLPPFINNKDLVSVLNTINVKLVIKLHHLFDNVDNYSFANNDENIVWLKNRDLLDNYLELNSIIPYADAFITDYSGAGSDVLLGNKPIGYFVDDLYDYSKNPKNGFITEKPLDYMPGAHIYNQNDLFSFLKEVENGIDVNEEGRRKVSVIMNGFVEPPLNCCEKIVKMCCPRTADDPGHK